VFRQIVSLPLSLVAITCTTHDTVAQAVASDSPGTDNNGTSITGEDIDNTVRASGIWR
jgi:hypothetical protein